MELDNCFEIGFIIKPHGLKGAVNIQLDVDDPEKYKEMESVLVKKGDQLIPFFVSSLQLSGSKGILKLQEINSIDEARQIKSCALFLPINNLPPLGENQFYYHDVIGYTIVDKSSGKLGEIQNVFTGGNQDLILMIYKGKEVLIPVNDDIVGKADHDLKEVSVDLPDGLIDIYIK